MGLTVAIFFLGCMVMIAFHYWVQFTDEDSPERGEAHFEFLIWTIKGVLVPCFIWAFFNTGFLLRPLMGMIEATSGVAKFKAFCNVTASGVLVVTSYWTGITFLWLLSTVSRRAQNARDCLRVCLFWSLLSLPLAWLVLRTEGWNYAGVALTVWLGPLVHATLPMLVIEIPKPPSYTVATIKMESGKYEEAETEVIQQLEKCEDDFDGWMMLASLYANHFDDLTGAERTIYDTCNQPNVNPSQVAVALNQLADWQIKIGENPTAARRSLEEICARFPGSHMDRMARLRIDRLPKNKEEMIAQRKPKTFRLKSISKEIEPSDEPVQLEQEVAVAKANRLVEQLKKNPNDVADREELAKVFAEQLDKQDLALDQLELLLAMPEQSTQKSAEWLALMAHWQIRYQHDGDAARKTLNRLIHEYPQTIQAFAAQRRLNLMNVEIKMRSAKAAKVS